MVFGAICCSPRTVRGRPCRIGRVVAYNAKWGRRLQVTSRLLGTDPAELPRTPFGTGFRIADDPGGSGPDRSTAFFATSSHVMMERQDRAPANKTGGRNRNFSNAADHRCEASAEYFPELAGNRSASFRNRVTWPRIFLSERNIVVADLDGLINPQVKKNAGGLIEQLLAVHKDYVAALSGIELSHKPASSRFRNLTGGD
jgi:hypothetical protein